MNNDILWLDVVGYEDLYEVSNHGQVRTKKGKTTFTKHHGERVWNQRVLKQRLDRENSCRVNLWKDGKDKTFLVHRLVCEAFLENPENKGFVNHKDGNRKNNHAENLEWNTSEENNNHAFDNELISTSIKIKLVNIESGEEMIFRSMTKASLYIGRNSGYISRLMKNKRTEVDGYRIIIEKAI